MDKIFGFVLPHCVYIRKSISVAGCMDVIVNEVKISLQCFHDYRYHLKGVS